MRIVYELSLLVARQMAAGTGGSIIHISSVGGLRAHRGLAGYDASKGAIDALTRSMAIDLAPHRIRVNAVAPGATHTRDDRPEYRAAAAFPSDDSAGPTKSARPSPSSPARPAATSPARSSTSMAGSPRS